MDVEGCKARMASLLQEAGAGRRSRMAGEAVQNFYGPVFNGEVRITQVTLNQGAGHGDARRELLRSILSHVNANGLQGWLGDYLRSEFEASGLMDLTDGEVQVVHAAVIARP